MGIYDREYYQEDDSARGFHLGGQRLMVTNLVIFTIVVFIADTLAGGRISQYLSLENVLDREPWKVYQLLTSGFIHFGVWHLAFNMFLLWMFGRFIEIRLGRKEFVAYYLVSIVFASFVWALWTYLEQLGQPNPQLRVCAGASGGVSAIVILFVLYEPKRTLYLFGIWEMPAWVLGVLFIGIDLLRALTIVDSKVAWQAHLGGAALAFLYAKFRWNFSRFLPQGWKLPRGKPKLRIHDPQDKDADLASEADRILEKVHREGEESLTWRERRILEKYSRSVRDRRGD
jgi:membrane associated rhomboid family serine protease